MKNNKLEKYVIEFTLTCGKDKYSGKFIINTFDFWIEGIMKEEKNGRPYMICGIYNKNIEQIKLYKPDLKEDGRISLYMGKKNRDSNTFDCNTYNIKNNKEVRKGKSKIIFKRKKLEHNTAELSAQFGSMLETMNRYSNSNFITINRREEQYIKK